MIRFITILFLFSCSPIAPTPVFAQITGANLQSYVAPNKLLQLPPGVLTITENIILPSNIKIIGSGVGVTTIKLSGNATTGFVVASDTNVTISDLTIRGNYPAVNISNMLISSVCDLVSTNGIGTEIGISVTGKSQRIILENIVFSNLSETGLYITQAGQLFGYLGSVSAINLITVNSYSGYYITNSGAYNTLVNIKAHSCLIGLISLTSNTYITNSNFSGNRVGFYGGYSPIGGGDSHSSISNTAFNHNILYNIAIDSTTTGWFFTGCEIFGGTTYLSRCKGFTFNDGRFEGTLTVERGGVNVVNNSYWYVDQVTKIGTTFFHRNNNYSIGGTRLSDY